MSTPISLKIAYISGGSRDWARKLMIDLALCPELTGEVTLYDIDMESTRLNEQLGNWMQDQAGVLSCWHYVALSTLRETLQNADFVVISIHPSSLELMRDEIALAEEYGLHIETALTKNTNLASQAFFNDPSNHLLLDDAWKLFSKMLLLNRVYLPAMAVA